MRNAAAAPLVAASAAAGRPPPRSRSRSWGPLLPDSTRRLASLATCHALLPRPAGSPPAHLSLGSAARHQRPHPATFLGRGQLEAAAAQVAAAQPAAVFFNAALSGVQQRQLERHLGRPVLDRMGLIIAIFSQRARTSEVRVWGHRGSQLGLSTAPHRTALANLAPALSPLPALQARLQVELAALEYKASRLVRIVDATTGRCTAFGLAGEEAEIVSARERGRSGGSSGTPAAVRGRLAACGVACMHGRGRIRLPPLNARPSAAASQAG